MSMTIQFLEETPKVQQCGKWKDVPKFLQFKTTQIWQKLRSARTGEMTERLSCKCIYRRSAELNTREQEEYWMFIGSAADRTKRQPFSSSVLSKAALGFADVKTTGELYKPTRCLHGITDMHASQENGTLAKNQYSVLQFGFVCHKPPKKLLRDFFEACRLAVLLHYSKSPRQ
ncbi:hypothetical protein LguiA_009614 [Lonicera macranthoides]